MPITINFDTHSVKIFRC